MAHKTVQSSIWMLVRAQFGVVLRRQLIDLGFSSDAIKHRISNGRLHPVAQGVYAVGRRELTREGRWMAAVLSCGASSFLSHFSAAALWGLIEREHGRIEVSVRDGVRPRRRGLSVHRRSGAVEVTTHRGIPVTTVTDTLVDIAPHLTRNQLEAAIREADKRDLIDPEQLREALDTMRSRPGTSILRKTLDRRTFRLTDSELERLYLPISKRAGLPKHEQIRYEPAYVEAILRNVAR